MNLDLLLSKITMIHRKYDLMAKQSGGHFNIFDITNTSHDEVVICRVLYELLNPKGSHHQGNKYLRIFVKNVLDIEMSEKELLSAKVFREYETREGRRIDLVVSTSNYFIPIEVKIYAGDQKNQCYDYYQLAKNSRVYYLTRYGYEPSNYSAKGLSEDEIATISFAEDIIKWLELCLAEPESIKIGAIREVLIQFISTIRQFTNQIEEDEEMELINELIKSPDTMKSAFSIVNTYDKAKITMIKSLFENVENKVLEKTGVQKLYNEEDYAFDDYSNCNDCFKSRKHTYPGLNYLYKRDVKAGIDMWVRLEIDEYLVVGYALAKEGELHRDLMIEDEAKQFVGEKVYLEDWFISYDLVPDDSIELCPNFKYPNEAFFELFDKERFERFTDHCVEMIVDLLEGRDKN